jgi:hypothetical protein
MIVRGIKDFSAGLFFLAALCATLITHLGMQTAGN